MRKNQPVTQRRVPVGANANILSTTDPKGKITYINDEFLDISGFTREELIGQPHNIIRHPDMPRQAFYEFWNALQNGRSWMGLVKNRCKNGDHYWVHAYVTPIFDDSGNVKEYQSIRQAPDEAAVERAAKLYEQVRAKESDSGSIKSVMPRGAYLGITGRVGASYAAATVLGGAGALAYPSVAATGLSLAVGAVAFLVLLPWATAPLRQIRATALDVLNDPLAERVFAGRQDEVATVEVAITRMRTELQAVTKRLMDTMNQMERVGLAASQAIGDGRESAERQRGETQQVASAMEEMSQAVQEVAGNASVGAETAKSAQSRAEAGKNTVQETTGSVRELTNFIDDASEVIHQLASETDRIGTALELIQKITEQTNLLALNAAIEAARAGESGRGFAVVADEVRGLASNTASSTKDIQAIIESLQDGAKRAVNAMEQSNERARTTLSQAEEAHEALVAIEDSVSAMREASEQIASATEEQSATAEEINKNITNIDDLAGEVHKYAEMTEARMTNLAGEIERASGLIKRFSNG